MSDLILYIVKQLVTNPDAVRVDENSSGGEVSLVLTVAPEDMGLIIGKSGQTIKALRKILIIKAMADNVRVNLQLAEPEGGRGPEKSEESEKSEDQNISEPAGSVDKQSLPSEEGLSAGDSEKTEKPKKTKKAEKTVLPAEEGAKTEEPEEEKTEEVAEKHADEVAEQD